MQQYSAGPNLWSSGALQQFLLKRFGAATASFAASLLLLVQSPALADQTIVRFDLLSMLT